MIWPNHTCQIFTAGSSLIFPEFCLLSSILEGFHHLWVIISMVLYAIISPSIFYGWTLLYLYVVSSIEPHHKGFVSDVGFQSLQCLLYKLDPCFQTCNTLFIEVFVCIMDNLFDWSICYCVFFGLLVQLIFPVT